MKASPSRYRVGFVRAAALFSVVVFTMTACTRVATTSHGQVGANGWTRHGVLRMINVADPDTLDPLLSNFQISTDLSMFWAGYLFNWNDRSEFVPELATTVPTLANGGISKDGRTIVYHLRPGVKWHDGAPYGADDVIFTWHAVMNPRNNVQTRAGYDLIASIDKRDDLTIAVHLKRPYAPFIGTFFTMSGTTYPILPAHILAALPDINRAPFNAQPIGTGPFIVDHWQRGQRIVFRANPNYWRGRPKLDRIEYEAIPNENTVAAQLLAHEADLEYNASQNNYRQLQNIPGDHTLLVPFTQYVQIALNTGHPFLSDVRVRRALSYATDNARIIQDIAHGISQPAVADQPSFLWAFDPTIKPYPYDPARARAILDDAGWKPGSDGIRVKDGRRLTLIAVAPTGVKNSDALFVLLQQMWRQIGVELQLKYTVTSLFFASYQAGGTLQAGKFDIAFFSWINGVDPDDYTTWGCTQFPPNGQNVYHFCDRTLEAAEQIALHDYDRAARKRAYGVIQHELVGQAPAIFNWFTRRVVVVNADLKNFRPAHAVTEFWNPWEWEI